VSINRLGSLREKVINIQLEMAVMVTEIDHIAQSLPSIEHKSSIRRNDGFVVHKPKRRRMSKKTRMLLSEKLTAHWARKRKEKKR